jgi:hypothetical protein
MLMLGGFPARRVHEKDWRKSELMPQVIDEAYRSVCELGQEPPILPQHTKLQRKTSAMFLSSAQQHLGFISF